MKDDQIKEVFTKIYEPSKKVFTEEQWEWMVKKSVLLAEHLSLSTSTLSRKLLIEMREAQKDYFKDKTQQKLIKAKALETRVDKLLTVMPDIPAPEQTTLF